MVQAPRSSLTQLLQNFLISQIKQRRGDHTIISDHELIYNRQPQFMTPGISSPLSPFKSMAVRSQLYPTPGWAYPPG